MAEPEYKTVLIKLSGEMFGGEHGFGFDEQVVSDFAVQIKEIVGLSVKVGIVIGGGNFFRSRSAPSLLERGSADYIGMLGTISNSIFLHDVLAGQDTDSRIVSALEFPVLAELYSRHNVMEHLNHGRVVIFAAGTGHPYFTTDTAAALRASQIGADALIKCTNVDGLYDKDPNKYSDSQRYTKVTYQEVIEKSLGVMDSTALVFCRDNGIPIIVTHASQMVRTVRGDKVGSLISD